MRSPRGFLGAAAMLMALPVAALYQAFFPSGAEIIVHLLLAAGALLISSSVFDFRLPRWMQWTAGLSCGALGGLFLLQALSELLPNPALTRLAYEVLGQRVEAWLVSLFFLWCVAVLLIDSRGRTRIVGFFAVSAVACLDVYSHVLPYRGSSLNVVAPGLKLLYLFLPMWLLLESRKGESAEATLAPTR